MTGEDRPPASVVVALVVAMGLVVGVCSAAVVILAWRLTG